MWQYELFETIISEHIHFATNYEQYEGRKTYAEETAGGFYTVRLAILQKLQTMKKQASVLALRFINPKEYVAPLGVWVTREAARKALENPPLSFSSKELLLHYIGLFVKRKFGIDVQSLLKESKILSTIKVQKKLDVWV